MLWHTARFLPDVAGHLSITPLRLPGEGVTLSRASEHAASYRAPVSHTVTVTVSTRCHAKDANYIWATLHLSTFHMSFKKLDVKVNWKWWMKGNRSHYTITSRYSKLQASTELVWLVDLSSFSHILKYACRVVMYLFCLHPFISWPILNKDNVSMRSQVISEIYFCIGLCWHTVLQVQMSHQVKYCPYKCCRGQREWRSRHCDYV